MNPDRRTTDRWLMRRRGDLILAAVVLVITVTAGFAVLWAVPR